MNCLISQPIKEPEPDLRKLSIEEREKLSRKQSGEYHNAICTTVLTTSALLRKTQLEEKIKKVTKQACHIYNNGQ
jgi:hypothetical protein